MKGSDSIGLGKPFTLPTSFPIIWVHTQWLNLVLICLDAAPGAVEKSKNKERVWNKEAQDKKYHAQFQCLSFIYWCVWKHSSLSTNLCCKTLESLICVYLFRTNTLFVCVFLLWSSRIFLHSLDWNPTFSFCLIIHKI